MLVKVGYLAPSYLNVSARQAMQLSFVLFLNQKSFPGEKL